MMSNHFENTFGTVGSLPVLCWKIVAENVKDPHDIFSLAQASPDLRDLLEETGALLEAALKMVLARNQLISTASLHNCRSVSLRGKATMDRALLDSSVATFQTVGCPPQYEFEEEEKIQRFLDIFNGTTRSEFFLSVCSLRPADAEIYTKCVELLSHHGSQIRHIRLNLNFELQLQPVLDMLAEQLSLLPNVESVIVNFILEEEMPLVLRALPPLPNLRKLDLTGIQAHEADNGLIHSVMQYLITAYGHLLTDFSANESLFFGRLPMEIWNLLGNLRRFQLDTEDSQDETWNYVLRILAEVTWPHLHELQLGYSKHYVMNDALIPFSTELMRAVDNFRGSLRSLKLMGQMRDVRRPPQEIEWEDQTFVHLTKLCIGNSSNFPPDLLEYFARRFPNLVHLDLVAFYGEYVLEWEDYLFILFPLMESIKLKERDEAVVFLVQREAQLLLQ